ncbi:hypothetical protein BDR04DRAFT_1117707 [Suillus decipiens]|nr:hypothetical protein BDR04DRAFT_1117707 [Suillus decipiens]
MTTHTKLSSRAFLLMALLPQYLHLNPQMWGILEDRLMYECLSIVLKPLMKAAEIGIMMSDPVGNVHHCFMPLAAYIVNTLEACMLACMHRKTSLFILASYLEFGDTFLHPEHTHSITLEQLNSITVDPNDLEAYFQAYWLLADPSVILTPEPWHHWHKEFYDHDLQWCLTVVGAQELDFCISILQPTTGYYHFSGGFSKLKQVMDRAHRDLQHYIAWIGMKKPINNWFILKLKLMQSITASSCKVGALIQWSTDTTEHAHISEIKDPAWHTNNNNYDPQICCHLDCQEKL